MIARCIAILLLALLTVLPAAGEALAMPAAPHCAPAAHVMIMSHDQDHAAVRQVRQDCDQGTPHHQIPCAMMGLCAMTGCMALTGIAMPHVLASGMRVAFQVPAVSRLDGLALAPLLEPPRA